MPEDRPYWNMEIEPYLNTTKIKDIQLENLKKWINFVYERSPVNRRRMQQLKVKPESIKSIQDFQNAIPPVTKDDMRNIMMEYMAEFGPRKSMEDLLCSPFDKVILMAMTSGTTGEPTPYFFTQADLEAGYESLSRALWRAGLRPGNVVMHAMALSMFAAGVPGVQSLEHFGACTIPMGAEAGTERVLHFSRLFGAVLGIDAIVCTPSFAEHLIEKAPELIGDSASCLGIKRVLCGGEPGAGIPEVRKKIEDGFGAKVFDAMGLGPLLWASCDHEEYQGMHFLTEDTSLLELVDPETRKPIPIEDGATGALVGTPLKGEGLAVFRHIVGDIAQFKLSPCPCGKTGMRLKILGRIDDMLKVKGVLVYPSAIDGVIATFVPRVTGEFRILLSEPPPRVVPPLRLKVEYGKGVKENELPSLAKEIKERMHARIRINPEIEWVPPMNIERSVHKTRFIEKLYEKGKK